MEHCHETGRLPRATAGEREQWHKRSVGDPNIRSHPGRPAAAPAFTGTLQSRSLYECMIRMRTSGCASAANTTQLFLDLLDPSNCPAIQSSTIMALVTSLLDQPQNTRTFETIDGLLVVTSLFKSRSTSREVKLKLVEFLYFYLMPETPAAKLSASTSATNTAILGGRGKELIAAFDRRRETVNGAEGGQGVGVNTKTTEEKQKMLGKYLANVQDLVEDLKEGGGVFGVGAV
ncbi:hypothetical protein HRR83_008964 [Exophiala dermatitidis]|uniref:Cell division control protein 14 n=1 Tax=Exophiala dermatitidis TaxID=5970 RepID=A0AAN6EK89_EXODE|nr:hypothetical protein HRR73_009125 [Exophiala dermatitidis]KAJ4504102.1 hypothetical protein HRR74_009123 [Exophiala dermatitidis]KAJ4528909.1 hypothetical protein HRR76_009525 [Exophiala dermatitidis]KAJ4533131.1 hypothetical protein HRR77_008848 [Exophiala dermatitidis]KAJ4555970.1 hypothetical protein HRR79_009061 [Exophiala dermatitidis]